jgi:glycosyltransferase involved in cell wall biosynthesis
MRRVLIITYYWPPSGGAGVQRWLKFTKFLPEFGWNPVVYTPSNPESPVDDHSLQKDVHPDTLVIRKPIWEPYQLYKRFLGMSADDRINAGFLAEKEKPGKKENISVWIRGNLFIPDARKFWIRPSARYLVTYLKNHPVDAIVSTGPPHSMHLIARKVSAETGIPWLADFRDPWTGIDFYDQLRLTKRSDKKHHRLEKNVLQQADRVVVVGKTMAGEFHDKAGVDAVVIPNGYDRDDFLNVKPAEPVIFKIVHVGAMNRDRNHASFWSALSSIKTGTGKQHQFRLKLIGKLDISVLHAIKQYGLEEDTEILPYLSHESIAEELVSASLLYLPINNTPNAKAVQTGKIFEYIASGTPVLGVGPVDGDAADILNETSSGVMKDFGDTEGIISAILHYRSLSPKPGVLQTEKSNRYERRHLAGEIASVLDNLGKKTDPE